MSEQRHFYRKRLASVGYLILPSDEELKFVLIDLSIRGLGVEFEQDPKLKSEQIVRIRLPGQGIDGLVTVMHTETTPEGAYHVGFVVNRLDGVGDNSYWFREEESPASAVR